MTAKAWTILLVAILAAGQDTSQLPAYAQVRAKMIEALGGEATIRKHTAMTQTGTFEIAGLPMSGKLVVRSAPPYYLLVTVELEGIGRQVRGYDGRIGWTEGPSSGRAVLEGNDLAQMRTQANFYGPLALDETYDTVELAGRTEFQGKPCYKLSLHYGEGAVRTLYVDAASYLVAGMKESVSTPVGPVDAIVTFDDYREFDGLRVATLQLTDVGGLQQQRVVITAVSFEPHEPGTFEPPDWAVR